MQTKKIFFDIHGQWARTRLTLKKGGFLQGDLNQSLLIQMAITLKIGLSDPMLVKPKRVLEASIYFYFQLFVYNF